MHRIDPRIVIVQIVLSGICAFWIFKPLAMLCEVIFLMSFLLYLQHPKEALRLGVWFAFLVGLYALLNESNAPQIIVQPVFLLRKLSPLLGVMVLSLKALTVSELFMGLQKLHCPKSATLALAVALRFIPTIRHELEQIRNGMKTRGVPLNVITFAKAPAMTTEYMIIPFIMRCIKVADELSAAAVTRAIENPVPRGMRVPLKIRIKDIVYLMMVICSNMEKHSFLKQCLKLLDTEGLTEEMLAVRASRMLESGRLASYDRQVYRAVTARTEQSLAWAVYRMLTYEKAGSHVNIDTEISAEEKKQGIQLASEQRHAVTTALTSQLSVITGGPGTGKTLIQRFLLDIYRRKNRGAKIICCAPTGRAARRMEQSTGFPATTIHKALGLLAGEDGDYCEPEMLDADLIVVDEVSMMDIYLANHLFRSVPHGSQLVLIGDADQLPSVGPGAVLSEIIACGAVPVVRLDRIFRQSYGSRIAANAKLIRHGNLSLEYGEDFQFYDSCDMSASAQQIETLYLQETARYGVDNVALLTPYRQKTETGVNALNERLREKLNPQDGKKPEVAYRKRIYRLGDKVMQIKNCEDISNGDIGYITSVTRDDTDSVLTVDFGDGRIAEYDGSDLEMLDLAYASTIHKSQGSEYKSVIINLQCAHAVMLVRPLVYTAITRAKERVLIVGERRALCIAIKRTDTEQRGTMLSARIKELISNVKGDHYNGNLAQ